MGARIRAHDWAATPLGPLESWPPSLRTAVDLLLAARQPVYVAWGPELTSLYNDGYIPILGAKHPDGLGQPYAALFAEIWDEYRPLAEATLAGEAQYFVDRPIPLAGRGADRPLSYFTFSWTPLRDAAERVAGFYCAAIETTETVRAAASLRASEERQAFLLALSDALRPLADPVAIQEAAIHILGEHLAVDRTYYVQIDDERGVAVVERDYVRGAAPSLVGEHPLAPFGSMLTVIRAGRPFVADDAETEPALQSDITDYRARELRAFVSVPLIKNGAMVASMCVTSAAPRRWTKGEVALVVETAERTWAAVERARAEAALRASEGRFRTLADTAPALIWQNDADGRNLFVNRYFLDFTGRTADQIRGAGWHDLVHPDDADAYIADYLAAVRERRAWHNRNRVRRHDGAWRWLDNYARPLRGPDGAYRGHVGVSVDATATIEAEDALRASEARFRGFAESSADTLWIVDAATRQLEYLSPAFERLWGEPRPALMSDLGRWADLVHPEDLAGSGDALPRVLTGETVVQEYRIVRPSDGATRWIRDTGFPIRDERGRVVRVAGIAQDLTDHKHAEAALREAHATLERRVAERTAELAAAVEELRGSEGRLRLLLEQMPAALWTTTTDLRITTLVGAAVPASAQAGIGQAMPAFLFAHAGNAAGVAAAVDAHRRALAGAPAGFEVEDEAEGRTYAAHVEPLRDTDGRVVGTIGVAHDVTDRALLRLQDEFLALASHELRTPLTPTMGYLELAPRALAAGDTDRALRYVARATEQVGRLNALVGDLLDVGRLRGGKLDLERGDVDLAAVVRRAVEAAEVEAEAQGQRIVLDASAAPLPVRGDAGRLEQVALNLLTNAVKYAPRSPTVDVRLWRDTRADEAVLEVRDAGPGVPEADLPHLFSRFYQVARLDRPSRGGLGLGLYLVKELVEAHGGAVGIASVVGRGATFTVRLPLAAADAPETRGRGTPTTERGEESLGRSGHPGRRRR